MNLSGIGKTVYLHLQLAQMLLDAKPVLYQACDCRVYYLSQTPMQVDTSIPKHLTPPSHILVDFDGQSRNNNRPAYIENLITVHIILASSPGPTMSSNWRNQKTNSIWVLRNWESDDLWAALIFCSPYQITTECIRASISYFGLNPRYCQDAISPTAFATHISDTEEAAKGITSISQLVNYMKRNDPPDQRATNCLFDIVPEDSLLYGHSALHPRSEWAYKLILKAMYNSTKISQKAFQDLLSSDSTPSSFFSRVWESCVHFFSREGVGRQQSFTLRELGHANPTPWNLTIQQCYDFQSSELKSKLRLIKASGVTSYLQPLSVCYSTIDSMIYSQVQGVSSLVLFQMATNVHSLKVKGFESLQTQLPLSSSISDLRPSTQKPWLVVFVVPDSRAHIFTRQQTLIGNKDEVKAWGLKTRQFVLGLTSAQIYAFIRDQ